MIVEEEQELSVHRIVWTLGVLMISAVVRPTRWIAGQITSLVLRLYVHYRVQADGRAKCPACGIRAEHDLRWAEQVSAIVHVCKRCFAVWTEPPMITASQWKTTLTASTEEGVVNADGTRTGTVQHAQREPQIVNNIKPVGTDRPIVVRFQQPGGRA